MAKKQRQKNRPGKAKGKQFTRRIPLLSHSRKLSKKAAVKKPGGASKKPIKKKPIIKPKPLPVQKKHALTKPAAIKMRKRPRILIPRILLTKKPKSAPKAAAVKPDTTFIDNEKLPERYNSTDVTLMVRDPYWIHAYWETTASSVQEVKKKIGASFKKSKYTLRVHEITADRSNEENSRTSFDIDVDPDAQNWYINLWRDNATYFTDFGVRTPKGVFYPLARSNTVTTPRATISEMPDVAWMRAKGKGTYSYVNYPAIKPQTQASGHKAFTGGMRTIPNAGFPAKKDVRTHDLTQLPSLAKTTAGDRDKAKPGPAAKAGFTKEQSSKDMTGLLPPALGGSSAYTQGGASEQLGQHRDFCFEIGTELIVHGRTQPSAQVWFGAEKLPLKEDGSFALRFALPEGLIPLDFTAQSQDGKDTKTIMTSVQRTQTKYL